MISITVEIDETDLDDFIHVYTARDRRTRGQPRAHQR